MANQHVLQRLTGIQASLMGEYLSNSSLASATKGQERDTVVNQFLRKVFPPIYRFGTGDVTDVKGAKSGQLDIVIELPFGPSLPSLSSGSSRLYLAETVAAAIEVKSNISKQWNEATRTASTLAKVTRTHDGGVRFGGGHWIGDHVPLYVIAYTGWTEIKTLKSHVDACPDIAGAFIIDKGLYAGRDGMALGAWGLWLLIVALHRATTAAAALVHDPGRYGTPHETKTFKSFSTGWPQ